VADVDAAPPPPPAVPSPPPAVRSQHVDSVFDYMVQEEPPSERQWAIAEAREEMAMKSGAPSVFNSRASSRNSYRNKEEQLHSQQYEENGYTWGAEPVKPRPVGEVNGSALSLEFMTPAAKATKAKLDKKDRPPLSATHSRTNSGSEKKRKRQTDEQLAELEGDTVMADSSERLAWEADTPAMVHSGLTGGLSRLLSENKDDGGVYSFPAPGEADDRRPYDTERERIHRRSHKQEDPSSPLKRTRHSKDDVNGLGISIKGRAGKMLSMVGGALLPSAQNDTAAGKTRRRASSSEHGQSLSRGREGEKRERKKHRVHRHNGTSSAHVRHEHRSRRRASDESDQQRRKVKAIEYYKNEDSASDSDDARRRDGDGQMVVFGAEERQKRRCESFFANIPGTESEKGYSMNKALKRWHKDNDVRGSSYKLDEEKELWRALRLRRNDRGEIVVFF